MFIAKNEDLIILAKETREELEEALQIMVYTSIEETDVEYILYNGEYLTQEEIEQKERDRLDHLSLTKREVFLAIYRDKQITPEMIRAMLATDEAKIEFDFANDYFRGNPLISQLGEALGYTPNQLDYLFEYGEISPEINESSEGGASDTSENAPSGNTEVIDEN